MNSGDVMLYGALWRLIHTLHLLSVPLKEYALDRIQELMVTKLALRIPILQVLFHKYDISRVLQGLRGVLQPVLSVQCWCG